MKKRIRCLCLVLTLLLLAGCTGPAVSTTVPTGETTEAPISTESTKPPFTLPEFTEPTQPPAPPPIVVTQYLPETVENPDNLPVLKWVCLTESYITMEWVWSEDAAIELNQMLADRNMPFRIQFEILSMTRDNIYTAFPIPAGWMDLPEAQEALQDADLVYGMLTPEEMQQYLSPITEYVQGTAEPSLENSVMHDLFWNTGTVRGQIYGIPAEATGASAVGWHVDTSLMHKCGLTDADFAGKFWEMDALFARIYEKNGNKPFLDDFRDSIGFRTDCYTGMPNSYFPGAISSSYTEAFQTVGLCFAIDYSSGKPTVVNSLETDYVRRFQEAVLRYKEAGYTVEGGLGQLRFGFTLMDEPYTRDGSRTIPVSATMVTDRPGGLVSGVTAVSEHKNAAVQLLSLIAEDEQFRTQLFFGKEGRDYKLTNGNYSLIVREDGSRYSMDMLSNLAEYSPVLRDSENYYSFLDTEEKSGLEYRLDLLNRSFVCCPVVFSGEGLEKELDAVLAVMEWYYPYFTNGEEIQDKPNTPEDEYRPAMDEAGYNQMLAAMKEAGSEKIVAELQRQLDAWLAENPDWNK